MKPSTTGKFMSEKNVIIEDRRERLGCREKALNICFILLFLDQTK